MNSDLSTQWKTRQRTRKQSLVSDKEWVPGCVVKKAKHETEHIWSKLKRVGKYREKLFNICKKEKKRVLYSREKEAGKRATMKTWFLYKYFVLQVWLKNHKELCIEKNKLNQ